MRTAQNLPANIIVELNAVPYVFQVKVFQLLEIDFSLVFDRSGHGTVNMPVVVVDGDVCVHKSEGSERKPDGVARSFRSSFIQEWVSVSWFIWKRGGFQYRVGFLDIADVVRGAHDADPVVRVRVVGN